MVECVLGGLGMKDSTRPNLSSISSPVSQVGLEGDRPKHHPEHHFVPEVIPEGIQVLRGRYVSSGVSSKGRLKWLHLNCDGDEVVVKLPKLVGYSLAKTLQPNLTLQVWGRPHKDYLKALMVLPVQSANLEATAPESSASPELPLNHASLTHAVPETAIAPTLSAEMQSVTPSVTPAIATSQGSSRFSICTLKVCTTGKCYKQGSRQVLRALEDAVQYQQLGRAIAIEATGCLKNCKRGPTVKVNPGGVQYSHVQAQDILRIVNRHLES